MLETVEVSRSLLVWSCTRILGFGFFFLFEIESCMSPSAFGTFAFSRNVCNFKACCPKSTLKLRGSSSEFSTEDSYD
jgi:hypothetical protein